MKIVAQSLVPAKMPYVHLGYTAATFINTSGKLMESGLILIPLGVALIGMWMAARFEARRGKLTFLSRRSRTLIVGGVAAVLLGIACYCAATRLGVETYVYPGAATYDHAYSLVMRIRELQEEGMPVPRDMNELGGGGYYPSTDGWHRPMRLEVADVDGSPQYTIVSAGEDGVFGTADDIHVGIDGNERFGP